LFYFIKNKKHLNTFKTKDIIHHFKNRFTSIKNENP
jgi:hypothetical protein